MKLKLSKLKKALIIGATTILLLVVMVKVNAFGIQQMLEARAKRMYGMYEARIENEQSILQAAAKYHLDKTSIVTVAPESYRDLLSNFAGMPEVLIFDKQGRYIEYKTGKKACNAGVFGFIPQLEKNGQYNTTAKTNLAKTMNALRDIKGNPLSAEYLNPVADYYIMISWTAWTGKLNEDHVYQWQALAEKNTKAKIQVIEVNLDAQQWWPKAAADSVVAIFTNRKA